MNQSKYILLSLLFCLLAAGLFAQTGNIDKIIAVVGDKIILKSDIEIQKMQMEGQGQSVENADCALLEDMLLSKMLLTHAEIDSISVGEDEVEAELDNRIRYFINLFQGDQEKLEAYYDKSIVEIKEEFRDDIRQQLLSRRMQQTVIGSANVTPSEVKAYFDAIPSDSLPFFNAEVKLNQIVIKPKISPEQKKAAWDKLSELKRRIEEGEDFSTLAIVYSDDRGSAENGGELGFLSRGDLVSEFASAGFRLNNDEMSNIVETEYGLHLIQMIEKRGEKANMRHILVKPEITGFDLEKAQAQLIEVRKLILKDSISFNQAVNKYSEDEQSKNSGGVVINPNTGSTSFEMAELEIAMYSVIDTMKAGEISKPSSFYTFDGSPAYRIIYLKESTEAHQANLDQDYERIKTAAEKAKQQEALIDWIKKKSPETFIHIEPEFIYCDSNKRWIK